MKISKLYLTTATMLLIGSLALPTSAALLGGHGSLNVSGGATMSSGAVELDVSARSKADAAIDARVAALNALVTRIDNMQKISTSDKDSLNATLQAAIGEMIQLKAKIDADSDNATLKADIKSIAKSYRVYLLVLPQGRITAAADRVIDIANLMQNLSAKLQARITSAQNSGQNVSSLNASLTDMNNKIGDANTQAKASISEVINLQADNGDKTVFQSNLAVLKDARAKIRAATADLVTTRQDAGSIIRTLMSLKVSASASSTATTTTQ